MATIARLERERDEENRQKRQLHLVYMLTVEQLAEALGLKTIEGKSTSDLVDMVKELRKALEWYANDDNYVEEWTSATVYCPDSSAVQKDSGDKAKAALKVLLGEGDDGG